MGRVSSLERIAVQNLAVAVTALLVRDVIICPAACDGRDWTMMW
jgi:hypothetical protein